jgi:DNA-binding transcriptional MerR regulator
MPRRVTVQEEELLTRREAAELAGVHINTIRLWERTGRVHPQKLPNGIVMIPRAEVESIISNRREGARTDAEHMAELEAEVRMLREEKAELSVRYEKLLDEVIRLAAEERKR